MKKPLRYLSAIILALAGSSSCFAADRFAGQTITILVGSSAGGGYDTYARLVARHLGNYIPGKPDIIVRNQAGAGSGSAAAVIYNSAPKDGTWIGAIFPGIMLHPILDKTSPLQFDPRKFQFLGSADNSTRICFTKVGSKTSSFEDARKQKTIVGASAAGGSTRDYAYMLNNVAGAKFEVVSGYKGSAQLFLAIERGEVEGICGIDWASLRAQRPDWVRRKEVNILVETALEATPELTDLGVPTMWKYIQNDSDRQAAELIVSQQVFGRPYVVAPETPEDAVDDLRRGFEKVLADKDFLADAAKSRVDITSVTGDRVQQLVERIYNAQKLIQERAREIIQP